MNPHRPRALAWARLLFGLAGLGMVGGTLWWVQRTSAFLEDAVSVPGIVVDLERTGSDDDTWRAVVRYSGRDGAPRELRSETGSSPAAFSIGERVEVLYRPMHPDDVRIAAFSELWLGPLILGIVGLAFMGAGVAMMREP